MEVRNFSHSYLSECLTLEVTISNKKGYVVTLYRSPSEASDEFDSFISNLEKFLINITSSDLHFVILLGDLNAKSKSSLVNEKTSEEGVNFCRHVVRSLPPISVLRSRT